MANFKLTGQDYFGKYCRIEMKRFGVENEFYIHKIVGHIKTNNYMDVPLVANSEPRSHNKEIPDGGDVFDWLEDVLLVIQCGVDETKVIRVALKDVEILDNRSYTELKHEIFKRNELISKMRSNLSGEALAELENTIDEFGITLD